MMQYPPNKKNMHPPFICWKNKLAELVVLISIIPTPSAIAIEISSAQNSILDHAINLQPYLEGNVGVAKNGSVLLQSLPPSSPALSVPQKKIVQKTSPALPKKPQLVQGHTSPSLRGFSG